MANEWFYTLNGQQADRPVSSTQLKQLAASGQLQPTDMVWQDGMPTWAPASSVKGLFPASKLVIEPPAEKAPVGPASRAGPSRRTADGGWLDMHPLLVLVLTLCTAGLFGLAYSYKVCQDYSARGRKRTTDGAARPLGRVRHPLGILLLSYLTGGFYFYYWVHRVLLECDEYTGRKDFKPRSELALMLICPPYTIYLTVFRLPDVIRRCQTAAGVPETPAFNQTLFFLNPCLFFALPFLGMIYQETLNQVWLIAP